MKYIVETPKSVAAAVADLQKAVTRHGFGVLHVHDLKETLGKKGIDFPNECRILDVCNPRQAEAVLREDMDMNLVLPCRISVYQHSGGTRIGMIRPTAMLAALSPSEALRRIAQEVEQKTMQMIDESK